MNKLKSQQAKHYVSYANMSLLFFNFPFCTNKEKINRVDMIDYIVSLNNKTLRINSKTNKVNKTELIIGFSLKEFKYRCMCSFVDFSEENRSMINIRNYNYRCYLLSGKFYVF